MNYVSASQWQPLEKRLSAMAEQLDLRVTAPTTRGETFSFFIYAAHIGLTSVPGVRVKDAVRALAAQQVQAFLEHDHAMVRARAGRLSTVQFLQLRCGVAYPEAIGDVITPKSAVGNGSSVGAYSRKSTIACIDLHRAATA